VSFQSPVNKSARSYAEVVNYVKEAVGVEDKKYPLIDFYLGIRFKVLDQALICGLLRIEWMGLRPVSFLVQTKWTKMKGFSPL
jgi:hypothetical protein